MFTIVTKPDCRYCTLAKSALDARGFEYEEIPLTDAIAIHMRSIGRTTVPQIHHMPDGALVPIYIGGCDDLIGYLKALES